MFSAAVACAVHMAMAMRLLRPVWVTASKWKEAEAKQEGQEQARIPLSEDFNQELHLDGRQTRGN